MIAKRETLAMFALILAAPVTSGCQTGLLASGNAPPGLRHPLFQRQQQRPLRGHADPIDFGAVATPAGRATSCRTNFQHPLLNRCWPATAITTPPAAGSRLGAGNLQQGLRVAAVARNMLTRPRYRVGQITYNRDCSGFVLAVLARSGYDTSRLLANSRKAGGTASLYYHLRRLGLVHRHRVPLIGDLVFFDNTYDRNGDGRANDLLTHVGIVEHVDSDGTVTFVHRVRRGELRYRLNLFHPHLRRDRRTGKALNHPLRLGTPRHGKYSGLTGELFHAFATLPTSK